jgi:hypothetical protein
MQFEDDVKQLKAELQIEEEAKANALIRLPLYSCRITGWKFVCSKCYDKVYYNNIHAITKTKPVIQKSL